MGASAATRRVREDLPHERATRGAAAEHQRLDARTACLQRVDNLGEPLAETTKAGHVKRLQAFFALIKIEADHRGSGSGIGAGRAVAEKFRQNMQTVRKPGRGGKTSGAPLDRMLEFGESLAGLVGPTRRMQAHQTLDGGPEGAVPALREPLARQQHGAAGSPEMRQKLRRLGQAHATRRRAQHQRGPTSRGICRAERAQSARMGVDQACSDRRARLETHRRSGGHRQADAQRRSRRDNVGADPREILMRKRPEANAFEELAGPSPLVS